MTSYKRPVSVLVVIHTAALDVLLLERAAHPGYWQSVTGSQEEDESLLETARREVAEETGLIAEDHRLIDRNFSLVYEIFPEWRHRYAPGVTQNTEHLFMLQLAERMPIRLAPDEHRSHLWLPWRDAAAKVFSYSNRDAILSLGNGTA
ncbi:MAG: dihydroneopterin triphosphate diphosphatase [Betaproteobacteria bacterium]